MPYLVAAWPGSDRMKVFWWDSCAPQRCDWIGSSGSGRSGGVCC